MFIILGRTSTPSTVKCRYNAVFGVQEIDRVVIAAGSAMDVLARFQTTWVMNDIRES